MQSVIETSDGTKIVIHFDYNKLTGLFDDFKFVSQESYRLKENIQIKKAWEDGDLTQLEIICWSEFITARQGCYIQMQDLIRLS